MFRGSYAAMPLTSRRALAAGRRSRPPDRRRVVPPADIRPDLSSSWPVRSVGGRWSRMAATRRGASVTWRARRAAGLLAVAGGGTLVLGVLTGPAGSATATLASALGRTALGSTA